jgi:hypothetical protein
MDSQKKDKPERRKEGEFFFKKNASVATPGAKDRVLHMKALTQFFYGMCTPIKREESGD